MGWMHLIGHKQAVVTLVFVHITNFRNGGKAALKLAYLIAIFLALTGVEV